MTIPPLLQHIDDEIARDRGRGEVQGQIIPLGQQNPKGIQNCFRLEIVVRSFAFQTIRAPTHKIPDFHGRFGVPRYTQHRLGFVRRRVDHFQLREDRIGLLDLFLGLHLATLVR